MRKGYSDKPPSSTDKPLSRHPALRVQRQLRVVNPQPFTWPVSQTSWVLLSHLKGARRCLSGIHRARVDPSAYKRLTYHGQGFPDREILHPPLHAFSAWPSRDARSSLPLPTALTTGSSIGIYRKGGPFHLSRGTISSQRSRKCPASRGLRGGPFHLSGMLLFHRVIHRQRSPEKGLARRTSCSYRALGMAVRPGRTMSPPGKSRRDSPG